MRTGLANFVALITGVLSEAQLLLQGVPCTKETISVKCTEAVFAPDKQATCLVRAFADPAPCAVSYNCRWSLFTQNGLPLCKSCLIQCQSFIQQDRYKSAIEFIN